MNHLQRIVLLLNLVLGSTTACSDSEKCGNATLDPGETCDTGLTFGSGACPTSCADDGDPCTQDVLENAGTCTATCSHIAITACTHDDACCPEGCNLGNDNDCEVSCGNGYLDSEETCDTAIAAGDAGACPTACDDSDVCTTAALKRPGTCKAACEYTPITVCKNDDACCLETCNRGNDNDCEARCGDGYLDTEEACDTAIAAGHPGACPTACNDGNVCTTDTLLDADTCDARCEAAAITACNKDARDGCCPGNCTNDLDADNADLDCVQCGNGIVDEGESCDIAIASGEEGACPSSCSLDGNACTIDAVSNPGTCLASCDYVAITTCVDGDGCCPSTCTLCSDSDCTDHECGDGCLSGDEKCDTLIPTGQPGACPTECVPEDPCVPEELVNSGSCAAQCKPQTPITACANDDGCCPEDAWCSTLNDDDCDNAPAELVFTTGVGTATCGGPTLTFVEPEEPFAGAVSDEDGNVLGNLGAGCLYLGGGNAHSPAGRIPAGAGTRTLVASVEGSTLHLVAGPGTGAYDCSRGPESSMQCLNESGHGDGDQGCSSDEDCPESNLNAIGMCAPKTRCHFGPPIPLPNPLVEALSACLVNVIREDVWGTADLETGAHDLSIPLASRLYLTKSSTTDDPPEPNICPVCTDNICVGGENDGDPCTAVGTDQTSFDCMPKPSKYLATVVVDIAPITTATAINDDGADFCPGQANPGAFLITEAKSISLTGSPAGNLADGEPHATTVVSTFCVPMTASSVDLVADLPGPGAISIVGELQLVRP